MRALCFGPPTGETELALRIYNTLSQQKEDFKPLQPGQVTIYVCGPTVYDFLHIGNFRGPIFFNLVCNWLEKSGYQVTYAMNFTDVDDRIIERAKKEGVESTVISERYIDEYKKDYFSLGLRKHQHNPKVTEYMDEIVRMIQDIIGNEKAYVRDGEVLFAVRKFSEYGKLSHKNVDDLQAGARVEVDQKKQDPLDFALWKPAKPSEPTWSSPWGEGRPGWHIECSAMVRGLFGKSIDIHGGGMDLIFPHHENEVAQSEGANNERFVQYWMHWNMLSFGDRKMSKSLGNVLTGREFLKKFNAEILKYMMLSAHYRRQTDFSEKQVMNAIAGLARVYSSLSLADSLLVGAGGGGKVVAAIEVALQESGKKISESLNDDFNTPEMFAAIFTVVRAFNTVARWGMKATPDMVATAKAFKVWMHEQGQLLSLFLQEPAAYLRIMDDMLLEQMQVTRADVDRLVGERAAARAAKDFAKSDELRDRLAGMGIQVADTPTGAMWEVNKSRHVEAE